MGTNTAEETEQGLFKAFRAWMIQVNLRVHFQISIFKTITSGISHNRKNIRALSLPGKVHI